MSRRVFVTGFGVISAIGTNAAENLAALMEKRSGFGAIEVLETRHRDDLPAFEIKHTDRALADLSQVPGNSGFTRTTLLALTALGEAIATAGLNRSELDRAGLVSATTSGGIRELETRYRNLQDFQETGHRPARLDTTDPGEHTECLAGHLGIRRYLATVSTACSSSANAIIFGSRLIAQGRLDCVLCGGADALSKLILNGFHSLMILDRDHCRPFDADRAGLNLGEGAAYLVLESGEALQRSGKAPMAEIRGFANRTDTFHPTSSTPDGTAAWSTMSEALARAGLSAGEISYINAHGTGTENNDLAEGLGIEKLFGDYPPPFSSTKSYTGHAMAAAGSIEAAFCLLSLQTDTLFPTITFRQRMPELRIEPVTGVCRQAGLRHILSNSFGFGGSSSSLLLSRCGAGGVS